MIDIFHNITFHRIIDTMRRISKTHDGNDLRYRSYDLANSYNNNQILSKYHLVNTLIQLDILKECDHTTVLACWYGSILFPLLENYTTNIVGYDSDKYCKTIGNKLHENLNHNIYHKNIWLDELDSLYNTDLIINTSCEHMPPMKYWDKWSIIKPDTYIVFQSNNLFEIKDHINCCHNLKEFEAQIPDTIDIISSTEIPIYNHENKYKRFTIIGQM